VGVEKKVKSEPKLEQNLKAVLEIRTAGDPDEAGVLWTDLSPNQIARAVADLGTPVSPPVVRDWLQDQGLALRQIEKTLEGGESHDRDMQFRRIAELKVKYIHANNPMFSVDTKAKEHLGQLYRKGRVWTQQAFQAFDHDFPSWATGVIIPHGIFDLVRNRGHINIGLSRDTSQFACDSFRWYWNRIGKQCYPTPRRSCGCAIVAAATRPISTSSSRICKNWSTSWASKFGWRTIRAIARSTTRSSAVSFLTWAARAKGSCLTHSTPWSA
jgi:Rhodopirellula transposase DDE domain